MNEIFKGMDNAAEQINENFEEIADYVVEQGENYTKWKSGKMEAWGSEIFSEINTDIRVPLGVAFSSVESVTAVVNRSGGYNRMQVQVKGVNSGRNAFFANVWREGGAAPGDFYIDYQAVGRWK